MSRGRRVVVTGLAWLLGASSAMATPTESPRERIASELERLRRAAGAVTSGREEWTRAKPQILEQLDEAATDLGAGRTELALVALGAAAAHLQGYLLMVADGGSADEAESRFATIRDEQQSRLRADESAYRERSRTGTAASRALEQAAAARAMRYHRAAAPYADATGVDAGYYYLGLARGLYEYASFVSGIDWGERPPLPALRSIDSELTALERRVTDSYRPPASIEHHDDFIRVNASLKLARELDEADERFGALYQYLETLRLFAVVGADADRGLDAEALALASRDSVERIEREQVDHTIAEMFLQLARSAATRSDDAAGRATARDVVDRVLPAYFAVLDGKGDDLSEVDGLVTVTLVRWPYT
ncbi:MAG TPA: hypothetical protein VD788_05245 [Candidatus Polarisedimenticolaceae bacterium]|nr:hypothetical protein [Candidatus Polarisedimenticolaceae bacterium]